MFDKRRLARLVAVLGFCLAACLATSGRAAAQTPASAYCSPPYLINWPTAAPVWSLCWAPPNASDGINGSGLEIYQAFYRGHRVFWEASLPVLNVKYDPGGCGGSTNSYRDWQNQLSAFEANNVISPGYAEPTVPPKTVLDHPGVDAGTFSGVAVERRTDRLILTTQMAAGWYRYIQKWTFVKNGVILPQFGFTGIQNWCLTKPHEHHAYWRFDFDIDAFPNNVVDVAKLPHNINPAGVWSPIVTETKTARSTPISTRYWRARNKGSGRGYTIRDGAADGIANAWAVADRWDLLYHPNELDDGGATAGPTGNAIHIDKYLNGENVNGQDIVVWYRAGYRHTSPLVPQVVGPVLYPFGPW
ncbi:MAG TPA: hypothetical protein VGX96_09865 [Candidatus Elarobacter sp.]|nr:hypothetical protein [Candidatus Elarobacter sp.]